MTMMSIDAATNLQVHAMPPSMTSTFPELHSSLIHWYGPIEKLNTARKSQQRMLFVTQQALYVCLTQGGITRCVQLNTVSEITISGATTLSLRMPPPNHDLTFTVSSSAVKDTIVHILRRLHFAAKGHEISMRVEPGTTVVPLPEAMLGPSSSAPDAANVLAVQQESLHVKYRDAMCDMVKDVAGLLQSIQAKDHQIDEMRHQLEGLRAEVAPLREANQQLKQTREHIAVLEKEAEAQRGLIHHLQAQRAKSGSKDNAAEVSVLRQELEEARGRLGSLRAVSIDQASVAEMQTALRQLSAEFDSARAQLRRKEQELAEKETAFANAETEGRNQGIAHTKELARIRGQFVEYDERIMTFIQKAFDARQQETATQTAAAAAKLSSTSPSPIQRVVGVSSLVTTPLTSYNAAVSPTPPSSGRRRDRSIL